MTGTDFEDVDLDRLADYVSGALDGTPEADAVADLIATDPRWTRAHAALVAADALVRADLTALADRPEPMPDDVAARIEAALAAAPPLTPTAATGAGRHLSAVPGGRPVPAPARRRQRWPRVIGIAAAIVAVGVAGVSLVPRLSDNSNSNKSAARSDSATGTTEGAPQTQGAAPGAAPSYSYGIAGSPGLNASGSDYNAQTLAGLGNRPSLDAKGGESTRTEGPRALEGPSQPAVPLDAVPPALRPLADPDARDSCVKAILKEYGGTATLLDYAEYQGSPALVVLLADAHGVPGRQWVVVVGPKCGSGGAIADERYSAQLR